MLRRHGKLAAFALADVCPRWRVAMLLALALALAWMPSRADAASDLSQLPHPFVDTRASHAAPVPIVFWTRPEPDEVKASVIVASWLGAAADPRDLRFPVSIGELLPGNAIVFVRRRVDVDARLGLPREPGTLIAMRDNPSDPSGTLLILAGDRAADLLAAAMTLVTRQLGAVHGDVLEVRDEVAVEPRERYGTPRWLDTSHPAAIAPDARDRLRIVGSGAIDVPFRLPPDLFLSARRSVPLRLRFEYAGVGDDGNAVVKVCLNGQIVSSIPLASSAMPTTRDAVVALPTARFNPYRNTLSLDVDFGGSKAPGGVMQYAEIDRASTIDLYGIPHSVLLPRLDLVVAAGYPFTAWPDLSNTAIVLSATPVPREYETLLNMTGHFGAQTGVAATGVTIVRPDDVDAVRDKDLVVLGGRSSQPLLTDWAGEMPFALMRDESRINSAREVARWLHPEWPFRHEDRERLARLVAAGYTFDAVLEQFVSPLRSDRSVVAVVPGVEDGSDAAALAFTSARTGSVYGGVTVSRNGRFESFLLGVSAYQAGSADDYQRALVMVHDHYWLILPALVLGVMVLPRMMRAGRERLAAAATWLRQNLHLHLPGRRPTARPF